MDAKQRNNQVDEKIKEALAKYHSEQRHFDNDPIWQKHGVKNAQEFKANVKKYLKAMPYDREEFDRRLAEMMKVVQTRAAEAKGQYKTVNFANMRGLRI